MKGCLPITIEKKFTAIVSDCLTGITFTIGKKNANCPSYWLITSSISSYMNNYCISRIKDFFWNRCTKL